jgi:RNA polymerase sigma-70 factor (ECF subfamily)
VREPEPETIHRAQRGDLLAFESLVRAYQADAWRFAYHLTRSRGAADDVTQEAFLRAFRAIRTYRGESKFTSWLLRIVRNCAVDAHRRRAREAALVERTAARAGPPGPAPGPPATEERLRIAEAIRRLPDDLREPFVVIEVLGFTYAEASVILSVNVGTLKSRMHRARAALARALSEGEAADEV